VADAAALVPAYVEVHISNVHGREEFQQWHASSPARFDHPVAHDEIRRFANAHLPE